jgi:Dolichyl-phosphate-mannose-protein mannosyltransferase
VVDRVRALPREALLAFALSRLAIVAAVAAAFLIGDALGLAAYRAGPLALDGPFEMWGEWDAAYFLGIASDGYAPDASRAAFYPLYPMLVHAASVVLPGPDLLAAMAISLAAGAASFVLLYRIAERRLGLTGARRAVLYLAAFPTTFFLGAVYTESLFLLLALATFDLCERRHYATAGVAAGLAMLTRPAGLAVVVALAFFVWQAPDRRRALPALAFPPALFALFPLLLWHELGDPLAFVHAQDEWARSFSPLGPLWGLALTAFAAKLSIAQLIAGPDAHYFSTPERMEMAVTNLEGVAYLVPVLLLLPLVRRRLGAGSAPYFAYTLSSLAIPLSAPAIAPLLSFPRFLLVVFPLFLVLATLGERRRVHRAIVVVTALLLACTLARWALFYWVA